MNKRINDSEKEMMQTSFKERDAGMRYTKFIDAAQLTMSQNEDMISAWAGVE